MWLASAVFTRKLNGYCHTAVPSHPPCLRGTGPVAPCDPASGSRTGGALRRAGGAAAVESTGLVLVYNTFQGGWPIWCVTHGAVLA